MLANPNSLERLRVAERGGHSDLWLVHNVFPVGSAAIYREAQRRQVPIVQYLHNYRPFSVNGYLWAGDHLEPAGLEGNPWPEIIAGSWQDSRIKTAWLAAVLALSRSLGWWESVKIWVAVSDFVRDRVVRAGIPAERVVTLRHFWRGRIPSEAGGGDHYLFLGRLTVAKGVKVLLDTWEKLETALGNAAPRLMIAGDGPLRSFVEQRARERRCVQYAGEICGAAKADLLGRARAIIVPSVWWEPLGLVVYEAYENSRPVLAARSGGLTEIVIDGETGLLHSPGDATELARQVMSLEHDPELRHAMGAAGRRWLEMHTDERTWRQNFLAIAQRATS